MSNSLWPFGLCPVRFIFPWDSPSKNTGVGCYSLLQGILLIARYNSLLSPALEGSSVPLAPSAGQKAIVRTGHRTTNWFKIGKEVWQGCILSPCLFKLYAEYIMWNSGLGKSQAGIKIARRNINNLRYAHDTSLMAESGKELQSLLMRVKEESENAGLKLSI